MSSKEKHKAECTKNRTEKVNERYYNSSVNTGFPQTTRLHRLIFFLHKGTKDLEDSNIPQSQTEEAIKDDAVDKQRLYLDKEEEVNQDKTKPKESEIQEMQDGQMKDNICIDEDCQIDLEKTPLVAVIESKRGEEISTITGNSLNTVSQIEGSNSLQETHVGMVNEEAIQEQGKKEKEKEEEKEEEGEGEEERKNEKEKEEHEKEEENKEQKEKQEQKETKNTKKNSRALPDVEKCVICNKSIKHMSIQVNP